MSHLFEESHHGYRIFIQNCEIVRLTLMDIAQEPLDLITAFARKLVKGSTAFKNQNKIDFKPP